MIFVCVYISNCVDADIRVHKKSPNEESGYSVDSFIQRGRMVFLFALPWP